MTDNVVTQIVYITECENCKKAREYRNSYYHKNKEKLKQKETEEQKQKRKEYQKEYYRKLREDAKKAKDLEKQGLPAATCNTFCSE